MLYFFLLITALSCCLQAMIANGSLAITEMPHYEAIENNSKVLLRCTTINLYVIDSLKAEDIIDDAQESDLKTEQNPRKQNILVYEWLKEVSSVKYESFLKVMKETEQEHVANLLRGSTEENELPLSNERYTRLEKIRNKMVKVIRIDIEVIAELRKWKTISDTDVDEIRAETVDYKKVSKLISAIMRRSNQCYNSFQEVLRKTLQTAAADFLSEGVMPAVHIRTNRPHLDEPLSVAFNDVIVKRTIANKDMGGLLGELSGLSIHPVRAIPGKSIVIFIYCKKIDNAIAFMQLYNSGRLRRILENILHILILNFEPHDATELESRLSLEDDDVISLEEFAGMEGKFSTLKTV